jgi:hypothetical protein
LRLAIVKQTPFEYQRELKPFVWGYYDKPEGFRYFESTEAFVDFVSRKEVIIYAHNGGKFDYHFLLDYIAESNSELMLIDGRISRFNIGQAEFRDSFNILPVALSKMQKDDIQYWKFEEENRSFYMDEIISYLKGDCVYLWEYIDRFINDYGLNLTLAGAAFNFWKNMGNKKPSSTQAHYEKFEGFYYGGRVSTFKTGAFYKGPFKYYDINSAYPYIMSNLNHPIGTKYFTTSSPKDSEIDRAFIEVNCTSDGALPKRHKNGIEFPFGHTGKFFITGHEFKTGLITKTIKNPRIIKAYVFEDTVNFKDYVQYFYDAKSAAKRREDKAGYLLAKLHLNSLYGKFATDARKWKRFKLGPYNTSPPKGWESHAAIWRRYEVFRRDIEEHEKFFYSISVSASITGAVRAFLWDSILKCREVFYCDTDSIICKDGSALPLSEKLGDWDLEATGEKLFIAGKKIYAMKEDGKKDKWKIASKGVRLSPEEIERVAKGEKVVWKNQAPSFNVIMGCRYIEREVKQYTPEIEWLY